MSKQVYRSGTSVGANVREPMEQREQSLKLVDYADLQPVVSLVEP